MTVAQRRQAVEQLVEQSISQRKACVMVSMSRSSYRYQAMARPEEEELKKRLHELAVKHPRYGYRRQTVLLRREGRGDNHKRVYRIWKEEGLQLPRRRKRKRLKGPIGEMKKKPRYVHQVWSYDFVFDGLVGGKPIKILAVLEEYSRKCLALLADTAIRSPQVLKTLQRLFQTQGRPDYIRSDNGPEFLAEEVRKWLSSQGTETIFITPGSPWENSYMESFLGKFRDECLNREWFLSLRECQWVIDSWRRDYNQFRPHSSLGYRTPAEAAAIVGEEAGSATLRRLPPQQPNPGNLTL